MASVRIARQVRIEGLVQAVGYRPFLYRLAKREGVTGWVRNLGGAVELHLEGAPSCVEACIRAIHLEAPSSADIQNIVVQSAEWHSAGDFRILPSLQQNSVEQIIPTDQAICPECLDDLMDPSNRRYHYPFTHCTQCGPRYTLIEHFPLDRENTAMKGFELCRRCLEEFQDPMDRRYHAQTLCCSDCGPSLRYVPKTFSVPEFLDPLVAALGLLRSGGILAARGVGGYHLLCDARSDQAVANLRARKRRPDKPLAVMMDPSGLSELPLPWRLQMEHASRPVVLVSRQWAPTLSEGIAPGLSEVGLILPDSPLHYLLSTGFGDALVLTSANISGEPMLTEPHLAEAELAEVADGFLHHNRPILRPADDAVFRMIGGKLRPLRLGRGIGPRLMKLRHPVKGCILAVGGDLKNTIAVAHENRVIMSPHVGNLETYRSLKLLGQVISDLCELHGLHPDRVICDAHPHYRSVAWAESLGLPLIRVPHHYAHASALFEETSCSRPLLVFTFDGLGYGADGQLWGGEALWGQPGRWQRLAGMRPLKLPGGDRASREPWRVAVALTWAVGGAWADAPSESVDVISLLEKGVMVPETSSVGRLFDAAAALTGLCLRQSYEGQAAMMLEAISAPGADPIRLPLKMEGDVYRWDWQPLVSLLLDQRKTPHERASIFHASLAALVVEFAHQIRKSRGLSAIGLVGGVFQNHLLTSEILHQLKGSEIEVLVPDRLPLNDAGLSFGQIVESEGLVRESTAQRDGHLSI